MVRQIRQTPSRGRDRKPQAIRRRAARRRSRHQLLDATALLLIALGLLYLASPARANELPGEQPIPQAELTSDDLSGPDTTPPASASVEPAFEPASPEVIQPAGAAPATEPSNNRAAGRPPSLYDLAAHRYGLNPRLLRALHLVESGGAADGCLANLEGSGATGPLQFKPATFRAYGIDADGDGRPNICGFVDSLFSAARYLRALGADSDVSSPTTRNALRRYGTDAELVVRMAG